jgi:hypothetical protein
MASKAMLFVQRQYMQAFSLLMYTSGNPTNPFAQQHLPSVQNKDQIGSWNQQGARKVPFSS